MTNRFQTPEGDTYPFPLAQRLAEVAAQEEVQTLITSSFLRPSLTEILRASAEIQLDVLILKGAALAETVYPRPTLRPYGDLDILVRPDQSANARFLLESLGYIIDSHQWNDLVQGRDCQTNFFKHTSRGSVVVELHIDLINNDIFFGNVRLDIDAIWGRSRWVRLADTEGRILGPEDQILHLCLHLAGHYLAAPQSLRDIGQVCAICQIDWPLFLRVAEKAGAATACFCGLYAASNLLGAPVPPEIINHLAPRKSRRRLEHFIIARATDLTQSQTEHLRFPLLWLILGSAQARLRAIQSILVPSPSWLIRHYFTQFSSSGSSQLTGNARLPVRMMMRLYRAHFGSLLRRAAHFLYR